MPKRTSAADATPIRVVVVTMDSHLSGAVARAQDALARELPGLELVLHGADVWGEDPAALERCRADIASGRHRRCDDAVPRRPHPCGAAGARGASRPLRCDGLLPLGRRGGAAHPDRQVQHGGRGVRRHGLAQASARQARRRWLERAGADEDAAQAAAASALHPGHRSGCALLFPLPAILARRLDRQHRERGASPDRPLRRRAPTIVARCGEGEAADPLSGCRSLPSSDRAAHHGAPRSFACGRSRASRHRRRAGDAHLSAGRQRQPLRRRDRGAGGTRPEGGPGVRERARCAAGHREVLPQGRPRHHRRAGLAHRVFARRRPGLQRRQGGGGDAGDARRAVCRRGAAGVPDAGGLASLRSRTDAGGKHHHGGDPGARRRYRPDRLRRPVAVGGKAAGRRSGPDPSRRKYRRPICGSVPIALRLSRPASSGWSRCARPPRPTAR